MDQDQINHLEWKNPNNWSGPTWRSLYFSKRDSRIFVPKQMPVMGWTLNLGRGWRVLLLLAFFLLGIPLLTVLILTLTMSPA